MTKNDIKYIENKCNSEYRSLRQGKTLMHPINSIYEESADEVYRRRRVPKMVKECSPFDNVRKIVF